MIRPKEFHAQPQRRIPIFRLIFWLAALAVAGYCLFFLYFRFFFTMPMPEMPPPPVTVAEVAPADIALAYEYAGRAAGSREVEIRPRVSGILKKRHYVEGQAVKAGSVLFTIDPAPFEAALAEARARFDLAQRDWARVEQLQKEQAISAREYDGARAAYEQARAMFDTARINLGYTSVTAPISGVASQESVSEGSLVAADSSLLTRLTRLDPIYVNFAYPDRDMMARSRELKDGTLFMPESGKLTGAVRLSDGSLYGETGTIDFTDAIIDSGTGTVRARAVIPNPDGVIVPGQFVRVIVKGLVRKNAIAIPDKAIMQGPEGAFVYTLGENGAAAVQPIVIGELHEGARIVESGLKAGDKVIVEGMIKVQPGKPVTIAPPPEAAPAPEKKPESGKE